MGKIPAEIDNYDWEEAFKFANGAEDVPLPILDDPVSAAPFDRADVKQIIALENGENDEEDWIALFELHDGRFAYLQAGCCTTGWEAYGGGFAHVAGDLDRLIRFGMGQEPRRRLGLSIPEDDGYRALHGEGTAQ